MTQQFFFYPYILDALPVPKSGFSVCQDMADKRLRLYITARGVKTFFVRKRVQGRDIRIILGNYPALTIDAARESLEKTLNEVLRPAPKTIRQALFSRVLKSFMTEKIHRSPKSFQKLQRSANLFWANLLNKKMDEITADELDALHKKTASEHGAATANRMREIMQSLFKYAVAKHYLAQNPAANLEPVPENRRKNPLTMTGLKKILGAIKREKNPVMRSAFLMLIFGFMKKSRVFSMDWNDLDLLHDSYNNHPLPDSAVVLLSNIPQTGQWIFPNGRGGHITDPRTSWDRIVRAAGMSGIQMNDCTKLLFSQLKWSNDSDTLRKNMNVVLAKLA